MHDSNHRAPTPRTPGAHPPASRGRLRRAVTAAHAALLLAAPAAGAQHVIDQQQLVFDPRTRFSALNTYNGRWTAQSFTPGRDNVSGLGFLVRTFAGRTGVVEYRVYEGLPNDPGATLVAAATTGTFTTTGEPEWADVFFTPVAVTVGSSYFVTARSTVFDLGVLGDRPASLYGGGNVFLTAEGSPTGRYQSFPEYDLAFRTYADVNQAITPEPATVGLVAAGLLGVAGARLRRRMG